jgi:hypothetical protein
VNEAWEEWNREYDNRNHTPLQRTERAFKAGWHARGEADAKAVEAEPELEGDPPEEIKDAWNHDAVGVLRSLVRATKNGIRRRIESLSAREAGEARSAP